MELESVRINRFRSVETSELTNCGSFNVLIGKNNSGKSNVLSAIETFFTCIHDADVVTLDPPIGRQIDFFQKDSRLPIEMTLTFALSLAERDALIREIVTEAPQMKNAVDGLDPSLRLIVTLSIVGSPARFSYVSSLALVSPSKPGTPPPDHQRTILSISKEAASELYQQLSRRRQRNEDADGLLAVLRQIDADDWRRMREIRPDASPRPPFRYFLRQPAVSQVRSEVLQTIESIMSESSSHDDFSRTVQTLVTRMKEEAAAIQQETLKNRIGTFAGEESSVPNYVRTLLGRLAAIRVLHLKERRKQIGKAEAERLLSLKVRRGGPEILRNIQETVSALLGVQIDAFESGSSARRGDLTAEMDVDNFLVEVNGSGIREALRMVLDVEFEHPQILLVEEPEIHLHPALETSMMRYLKRISSNCQVFISTHSTNFLDTPEVKNVYLVSKPEATKIHRLNLEDAQTQLPKELGIRLSSLFMYDRLVFVEGPSDEAILREWASVLAVNLSQANVGFIPMGGVHNITHYAAETLLSFLTRRQVRIWFVLDRDERDNAEIARLQETFGNNTSIRVLEKRELENYLLCPRVVREFIKTKSELAGGRTHEELPPEADVARMMTECTEKLKQLSIDKRVARILCKPVYPSTRRIFDEPHETTVANKITSELGRMIEVLRDAERKVEDVYREQSETVSRLWQSGKAAIVPGSELLDMVCREYGGRFKKERDGARLARLMRVDEIDEEIKRIISEIGG